MTVQDLPPNFDQLLNRLIDSQLSETEFEELEQYLIAHPQARQTYFDYLDINTGIQESNVERLKQLDQIVTAETYQSKPSSKYSDVAPKGNYSASSSTWLSRRRASL